MPCIILSILINFKFLIKRFRPKVCLTSTQKFKDESLYTHQRSTQTVFEYARSIKPIIHFVYNIHNLPLFSRRKEMRYVQCFLLQQFKYINAKTSRVCCRVLGTIRNYSPYVGYYRYCMIIQMHILVSGKLLKILPSL